MCCAQSQQEGRIGKINELLEGIYAYYYTSFDSALIIGKEIIRLSDSENRIEKQLEAIYTLCWCADYHKKINEFRSFVVQGNQLLKDKAAELDRIDTAGIHRASMIHATGLYYFSLGIYDEAIAEFSKIITFNSMPLTRDSSLLRSACNYLGQAYYDIGNLDKSIQYFEMANKFIQKNDEDFDYLHALYFMYQGEYQFAAGMIQDAFSSLLKAMRLLENDTRITQVRNSLISNLILMANFYRRIEKYDSAAYYVYRSVALHIKNDPGFIGTYRFLGDIFYEQGNLDSALFYYNKSLICSNQIYKGTHYTKAKALIGIANINRDLKQFEEAESQYKESLKNLIGEFTPSHGNQFSSDISPMLLPKDGMLVMLEQAKLYNEWFRQSSQFVLLDSCITILEKALLLNDASRKELFNIETKELQASLQAQITELGADASFRAFETSRNNIYLMKTFAFIEKSKGNILMDQVNEIRAKKFAGIPDTVLDKESRLKGELSVNKDRMLQMKGSETGFNEAKNQYNYKLREYMAHITELEQKYPRYYKLKYDTRTLQAYAIQKQIPTCGTLLIQYYIGNERIYMAGITRKQIILKVTERNDEFDLWLSELLAQLSNTDILERENDIQSFSNFILPARYLYTKILLPVLAEVESTVTDLAIIPDSYLCYLPFEILLTKDCNLEHIDYSSLPYLVKEYRIRYGYSASLLIGEPDVERKPRSLYIGFAPAYDSPEDQSGKIPGNISLGSLYANRDEIKACARIWNGTSITGLTATEESFRNFAAKSSILHLAIHTLLDDKDPQNSCFAFSRDFKHPEDGFLFTYELYGMNLPVRLAILSGCETGIGEIRKGEGIMSLARAFKFAGCPDIIMSLWKVNDQTTREIMILFNQNLKKGMEKDKALQQAKISYLKGPKNLHPAFWSSFVLIGNDDPIRHSYKPLYVMIAVSFVVLLLAVMKAGKFVFRRK